MFEGKIPLSHADCDVDLASRSSVSVIRTSLFIDWPSKSKPLAFWLLKQSRDPASFGLHVTEDLSAARSRLASPSFVLENNTPVGIAQSMLSQEVLQHDRGLANSGEDAEHSTSNQKQTAGNQRQHPQHHTTQAVPGFASDTFLPENTADTFYTDYFLSNDFLDNAWQNLLDFNIPEHDYDVGLDVPLDRMPYL